MTVENGNQSFENLPLFPFVRLRSLLADLEPDPKLKVIDLGIGEPQCQPPLILQETVAQNAHLWNRYPPPGGTSQFQETVKNWLCRRYNIDSHHLDAKEHILPLTGTKEGLFLIQSLLATQANTPEQKNLVLMPDPLYAVYLGSACLAGLESRLLPTRKENGFLPDLDALDEATLKNTLLFILCSPANPQGAVGSEAYLKKLLSLSKEYGFYVVFDECYSELWDKTPPPGGLEIALKYQGSFERVLIFNSLSKRSAAAGLRSGFIAGDPSVLRTFLKLRAYGASVQPLPLMAAAIKLWQDEEHVETMRQYYRTNLDVAQRCLGQRFGFFRPEGGFFLWLDVKDGKEFARRAWRQCSLKLLPGEFLSWEGSSSSIDDIKKYVRVALVHDKAVTEEALKRLANVQ